MFETVFGKLPKNILNGSRVADVPIQVGSDTVNIVYFGSLLHGFRIVDRTVSRLTRETYLLDIFGEVSESKPKNKLGKIEVRRWFSFTLTKRRKGWRIGYYFSPTGWLTSVFDLATRLVPYVNYPKEVPEVWISLNGNDFILQAQGSCPPLPIFIFWLKRRITGKPQFDFQGEKGG